VQSNKKAFRILKKGTFHISEIAFPYFLKFEGASGVAKNFVYGEACG